MAKLFVASEPAAGRKVIADRLAVGKHGCAGQLGKEKHAMTNEVRLSY
jgi:hypothetical protein